MIRVPLHVLRDAVGARKVAGESDAGDVVVTDVMTDSRVASSGPAVFFALATERADGHDHVAAAARSGAVVAVVERGLDGVPIPQVVVDDTWAAIGRLGRAVLDRVGCRVVAVTGSFGKTTFKDFAATALAVDRRVAASRGSFNNELGVPLTMLSVDERTEVLVAEAGARNAGDIGALGALLQPDVAVVTAVGPVHLETFGDEEGVAQEKSRLVAALGPAGTAVLNADDARVLAMAALAPTSLTVSAKGSAAADLRAEQVVLDEDGRVRALLRTPWGSTSIALPVPGIHHLTNALLAVAAAGVEGIDPGRAADAIASASTSPSRSALHRVAGVTVLDDAYNASPPTMLGALRTLGSLPCSGRRWAVLGVMAELGPTAGEQHVGVGRACIGIVDELIVVGTEASEIAVGAEGNGAPRIRQVADHAAAAALVAAEVRAGDAVLFKASRVATLDRAAKRLLDHLVEVDAA